MAVVTPAVGAEVSTAAVVVDDSSSVIKPHEMTVRLKHETRIMFKIFFIFSSKVNVKEIFQFHIIADYRPILTFVKTLSL